MNGYFCVLTIIDFFILCFMCILTYLSESLSRKQKRGFLLAFVLIAEISILEVITLVVDGLPPAYRWLNVASNYMGFGLSPAVCICLVYVLDRKTVFRRKIRTAILFEIGYLIFLFVTIPYGIVFSVSADNIYSRGPHFYIYIIMMAETIIQVVLPKLHVTWLCITLLSVLYFIYCNEMWNQLDALTGLLNQNSYLRKTGEMGCKASVLVVFDVDDFKQINDSYGHVQGDLCLAEVAECIKKAYANFGYCYRIGGDEFCVLLKNADKEDWCKQEFLHRLEEKRRKITFLPTVSYGSASFSCGDIVAVKDKADRDMYQYKYERKNRNGMV